VVEVALSLQFERIELTALRFAAIWERFRDSFPKVEEQPPLPPALERFDAEPGQPEVRFQLFPAQFTPRYWLVSESGNEVVQIQQDRLIYNWRKVSDEDRYPRYTFVRQRLGEELGRLREYLAEDESEELVISQSEVTYINHILPSEVWEDHADVGRIFTFWANPPDGVASLEAVSIGIQSLRHASDSIPLGRLYVNAQSALRATDRSPIFALTLVGRGAPESPTVDAGLAMLDVEHEWIVRAFADATTAEMHQVWGRADA
jgi:uncharacterized protein (TIGR04255 family)